MERKRGFIRPEDMQKLRENRAAQEPVQGTTKEIDFEPVVRLYIPFTGASWLLTELDSDDVAFALCDLGQGFPELGSVYLPELEELEFNGLRVLQDTDFRPRATISRYATEARGNQQITL